MATIKFIDRKAAKPSRYLVTPESGEPFYATLHRADEPLVEGTALNAAALNNFLQKPMVRNDELSTVSTNGNAYADDLEVLTDIAREIVSEHLGDRGVMTVSVFLDMSHPGGMAQLTVCKENDYATDDFVPSAVATLVTSAGDKLLATAVYNTTSAAWEFSDWMWENPPMEVDVEYLTTERYMGKPVYCKCVSMGNVPAANSSSSAASKYPQLSTTVDVRGVAIYGLSSVQLPVLSADGALVWVLASQGVIMVYSFTDNYTDYEVYVTVKYTKQ